MWSAALLPALLAAAAAAAANDCDGSLPLDRLEVKPGFQVSAWHCDVPYARGLVRDPRGTTGSETVYVGTRRDPDDAVYVLEEQADGSVTKRQLVAGLNDPNSVEMAADGTLYVAVRDNVLVFEDPASSAEYTALYPDGELFPTPGGDPDGFYPTWHYLRLGPDDMLYASVGSNCSWSCESDDPRVGSVCDPCISEDERFASILRFPTDGQSAPEVFASGIRFSVGFDWHPVNEYLWFSENGHDNDPIRRTNPPDELNRAFQPGLDFGYPSCHGADIDDPTFFDGVPSPAECICKIGMQLSFGEHVAPLGLTFYDTVDVLPTEYVDEETGIISMFVAEHGGFPNDPEVGNKVSWVQFEGEDPLKLDWLVRGWGDDGEGARWGRPVDIITLANGDLLVSDDQRGIIYKISYVGEDDSNTPVPAPGDDDDDDSAPAPGDDDDDDDDGTDGVSGAQARIASYGVALAGLVGMAAVLRA